MIILNVSTIKNLIKNFSRLPVNFETTVATKYDDTMTTNGVKNRTLATNIDPDHADDVLKKHNRVSSNCKEKNVSYKMKLRSHSLTKDFSRSVTIMCISVTLLYVLLQTPYIGKH